MRTGFKSLLGLCAFSLVLHAAPAAAQTAIQPGTIVGTFMALGYVENVALTVPADRAARITDVKVIGLNNSAACLVYFVVNGLNIVYMVPPKSTIAVPLNSGYGLVASATVQGSAGTCSSGDVWMEIRGFYFTIP